jgi:trans-aconitate methyltransferase
MNSDASRWTEPDSEAFTDIADVAVPSRREQLAVLLSLIPAADNDAFEAVDLGCGEGLWLERLLECFPHARAIGLDGSEVMRQGALKRLERFGDRAEIRRFELDEGNWAGGLRAPVRCILSSLTLHHLDDTGKRRLFRALAGSLEPGGALLVADVVAPGADNVRRSFATTLDKIARQQSLEVTKSLEAFHTFQNDGWNPYWLTEPVPGETPSRLFEQLKWLQEAGFSVVDCFWMRAGFAIYGGYR